MKNGKRYAALIGALLMMAGSLIGCGAGKGRNAETPEAERETVDLTDERAFTPAESVRESLRTAFADTQAVPESDLTYEKTGSGVTVTGYTGGEIVLRIPDTVEGMPVTAVAKEAFKGLGALRAVCLPDSVVSVGFGAFEKCTGLATLRTPVAAAEGCSWFGSLFGAMSAEINASGVPASLTTVILTGGTEIPHDCFCDCHNLAAVSLPEGITSVGAFAFYGCSELLCCDLPDTVATVGERAFANCASLLSQTFGTEVTEIGAGALEGCAHLEELTIPFVGGSRTENTFLAYLFGAEYYTLSEGFVPSSLIRVTLSEGCAEIPANGFFECVGIREVVIPASVTSVGDRAFYRCFYLASVTLPDGVALGADAFHSCIRLRAVDLSGLPPLSLDARCTQAFMDCRSLTSVTLPADTKTLPASMFSGCYSLSEVGGVDELPLGNRVFYGCDALFPETDTQ